MDHNELILENVALMAEVARLKLQNESLEIRLTALYDQNRSLHESLEGETYMRRSVEAANEQNIEALRKAKQLADSMTKSWCAAADHNEKLRDELMRRGADDPLVPKPQCQTALAALQVVRNWDRDVCLMDLRKQRVEHLKRIDVLKLGQDTYMDDVVKGMRQRGSLICDGYGDNTLYEVLTMLRSQLQRLYSNDPEWTEYPLTLFVDDAEDNMEDL